ncbi:MAG: BamA/TamA family outer membrane protein [candidate division KSB1 bacterium]|jgi:Tol biopolymer transport system component|nr:BamA/TamA family outer membrane protein [candidate division KSB1 bacterium]
MTMNRLISLCIGFLLLPQVIFSQYFGKNKVQYEDFNWQYIQSEHFDIYFTDGGESIAEFVAEISEASYKRLSKSLRYDLLDRIKIITYNSHNDFGQTNVTLSPPDESVGGFTEFFKNRVVIPFEGNWEQFRHVIHHELTHAVMLQMVYGAGTQSIITGMARLQLPLWLIEGLAEYESRGWDTESDMYIRDAALNGYVPNVSQLYGFMAYKGGQSVLYYLSEKYGQEKIGELLGKIKVSKSMVKGMKQAIGVDPEDLTEKWHMHLKREYWPDIADRKEPEEFAKKLTDHEEDRNFVNSGPALSPNGDKIAYLSDRSDYFDIYLLSAIDGKIICKLVSGQQTSNLEELHWLRAGISWSPDGEHIVFAAKAGDQDALHLVDVDKRKIVKTIKLSIDGIFSPAWSPNGEEIAFMGIENGQGDIYAYHLQTRKMRKITDDVFSDLEPTWSADGKMLTFASDRGDYLNREAVPEDFEVYRSNFYSLDIYTVDRDGYEVKRITDTRANELSPVFSSDGDRIAFVSDRKGIYNIYIHNLESGIEYPITNVLTGIFHLSWEGRVDQIAFTSFYKGGYDIYLMKNPSKVSPGEIQIQETNFIAKNGHKAFKNESFYAFDSPVEEESSEDVQAYKNYIFDSKFKDGLVQAEDDQESAFLDSSDFKLANGEYKVNNYKIKFSPDLVYGNASYSQFFGFQGATQIALSDILGNHRIYLYTNLFYDLKNSNFQGSYFYLPKKMDYGAGGFHYAYYFYTSYGWVRDRNYGFMGSLSYPFSKFRRTDFSFTWLGIDRDYLQYELETEKKRNLFFDLHLVNDTVVWGYTGPVNGTRSSYGVTYSPGYSQYSLDFLTFRADWRKYLRTGKDYNFVVRLSGGFSEGKEPQKFFLGGTPGWLNYSTRYGGIRVNDVDDIYFSSFEMPMRGGLYYERVGNRFALANLEFRFPFIRYFIMGWPLPLGLANIRGALFVDAGSAWDDNNFRAFRSSTGSLPRFDDIFMGYGFGARLNLGFFLLRFDAAWTTDLASTSPKPVYYFSLGPEF